MGCISVSYIICLFVDELNQALRTSRKRQHRAAVKISQLANSYPKDTQSKALIGAVKKDKEAHSAIKKETLDENDKLQYKAMKDRERDPELAKECYINNFVIGASVNEFRDFRSNFCYDHGKKQIVQNKNGDLALRYVILVFFPWLLYR